MRVTAATWPGVLRGAQTWERIRRAASTEAVFMTPEWLETWWRHLGPGYGLRLLTVEDEHGPRAIAPLHRAQVGATPFFALRPLGLGVTDYADLLLPPDPPTRERCAEALLSSLVGAHTTWDALDLQNLPSESPTIAALLGACRRLGLRSRLLDGHARPRIDLRSGWEAVLGSKTGKFRYNLRSRLRRLGEHGRVSFRRAVTREDVSAAIDVLAGLHARRWEGQYTATVFSRSASAREFYREACERYARRGMLDLVLLEVGGRPVAGSLGFIDRHTYFYYLPAWDPDLAPLAPSSILLAHLIETACERRLTRFDFMLGDEPYKAQWATEECRTARLVIGNVGARGAAALESIVAWHGARQWARSSPTVASARRYGVGRLRAVLSKLRPG
ncbi:MAG: GNAT family N-acetyltransferase [Chloroflexota bacterium]